ncbi:general amino acid permease [Mycena latifolia]|nr:general amino acid permease [Mycena latifolia]
MASPQFHRKSSLAANDDAEPHNRHQRDQTHRTLKARHIQLIAIGGTIGTVLFVQIGTALPIGGPGSLLVATILWSTVVLAINNCLRKTWKWSPGFRYLLPIPVCDEALGVCSGLNLFFNVGLCIPFEITAFNLMLDFWTDKIPVVAVIIFMVLCYAALNFFAVRFYGESEFWLALGKIILILGLLVFTFVVMVGGNPEHKAFGFRNWDGSKVSGAPFVPYVYEGSLGRFVGFLGCMVQASFTVAGPEFLAITAGEAVHPRRTLPRSFSSITARIVIFCVLGVLSVGVLVPHTDPGLLATAVARPGAGTSPYVIAMERLHIGGLADAVNALVMLSIFSAGNSYVYIASRTLFGLALEGHVPDSWGRAPRAECPSIVSV